MRLRTFTARDMKDAMVQVKATLGDNAIIVSSSIDRKNGTMSVTAALEQEEEALPPPPPPSASAMRAIASSPDQGWLEDLGQMLRFHNTPESLAGRLLYKARHLEVDQLFALKGLADQDR